MSVFNQISRRATFAPFPADPTANWRVSSYQTPANFMNSSTLPESPNLSLDEPIFPENETGQRRRLDMLAYAPCPLRNELKQRLHRHFRDAAKSGVAEPVWYVPGGCHSENPYDGLWQTGDAAELPGLLVETGFGDFNRPEFVRRWLETGVYAAVLDADVRPEFRDAGLVDPQHQFRVFGANIELPLVDLKRLGDRPLPRTWADVLHPRFKGDVIVSGEPGSIHESILFSLYRDHGEEGLAALGANVREFMHPAEMAKTAGSANPRGAAIYLLPAFFGKSTPHKEATKLIWPEEGAYLTPQYLLRKADAGLATDVAVDYLCGADWAAHLAKVGFAPARAVAPLPGKLRWIGWDFVRANDLEVLGAKLNAAFTRGYAAAR
jgi:hypothetical protein